MKTIYPFVAAVLGAGLLASCYGPYAAESGPTPLRTSGAYSSQFRGSGSTYHTRDLRDPTGDWRHDDVGDDYDDDDDDDADGEDVAYIHRTRYLEPEARYTSYRTWRPGMSPAELPFGARRVMIGGRVYYTHSNVWYQPSRTGYVIVRSPYY